MEAKDLVLLLMIPILLVGILTFVNNNSITGNVVAEQADNEKLGTYSVMPSFRAKMDYSLNDYSDLKIKLKTAIDKCIDSKQQDIKYCIKTETNKDSYNWNCNEKESDVLYDFTGKLKECINLKNENAVCRFSLDKHGNLNKDSSKNLRIVLTNWYYPRIKAELFENDDILLGTDFIEAGKLFYTDYDNKDKDSKSADYITLKLEFKDGVPSVPQAYAVIGFDFVKLSRAFLIYKSKSGIKFIDEKFEPSFRGPEPANTIIDLPRMQGLKFCAKTGKSVIAYDDADGLVKSREIVYRFAITLPNPVPAPVNSFEAKDNLKSENSALLIWKKDPQSDIKSYSFYYSTNDFIDRKMNDIKKDSEIKKVSVVINSPIEIESVDLSSCEFNPINEPCKYQSYNNPLLKNKLYYIKSENKFVYVLFDADFKDGTDYNVAITAVNDKGEEMDNDKSAADNPYIFEINKNYLWFSSADDLAPAKIINVKKEAGTDGKTKLSWDFPAKNIDGTNLNDIKGFNIYYRKYLVGPFVIASSNVDASFAKKEIKISDAGCSSSSLQCEYVMEELESGQYFITVAAFDDKNNEFRDFAQLI